MHTRALKTNILPLKGLHWPDIENLNVKTSSRCSLDSSFTSSSDDVTWGVGPGRYQEFLQKKKKNPISLCSWSWIEVHKIGKVFLIG